MELVKSSENPYNSYCSFVELDVPQFEKLPVGRTLEELISNNNHDLQRQAFQNAQQINIMSQAVGIGDAVHYMRHARSIAEVLPEKRINMYVPVPVTGITSLQLPPNLHIDTVASQIQPYSLTDDFFLDLDATIGGDERIVGSKNTLLDQNDIRNSDYVRLIREQGRSSLPLLRHSQFESAIKIFQAILEKDLMNSNSSYADIMNALPARILNVNATSESFKSPLLELSRELEQTKQRFDLLVVPDASIRTIHDKKVKRSRKSLSLKQWGELAQILPKDITYGFVRGVSHPEYSDAVFEILGNVNIHAEYLTPANLQEFISCVLQTHKMFGVDSGTTHLASEVIKSVQHDRKIVLRELFNGNTFNVDEYGVKGMPPDMGKILVYKDYETNMDGLPISNVTEFIFS